MPDPSLVLAGVLALECLGFRPLPPAGGSPLIRRTVIDHLDLMDAIRSVAAVLLRIDKEHPELGLRAGMLRIIDRPVEENPLQLICSDLVDLMKRARPFWPKETESSPVLAN